MATGSGSGSLLPKEHGVYGQLSFPTLTTLAVVGLHPATVLIAVAAVAGFLAHEPLLVLLGRRGPRAQREIGPRARRWLGITGATAAAAGIAAMVLAPPPARWTFAVPLLPLVVVAYAIAAQREKTTLGESAVAASFASVAVPMAASAGAPVIAGLAIAATFATLFIAGTLGVRVVILRVRGGGDAAAVRTTRRLLGAVVFAAAIVLVTMGGRLLPWATALAVAPGLITATTVAVRPPTPKRLRVLGWTLVSTSAFAAAVLIAALQVA